MHEIWKDVVGYEKYYQVSNIGRVRSNDRLIEHGNHKFIKKGIVLKQSFTTTGYKKVELSINKKKKSTKVHRMVLMAFEGMPVGEKNVTNHKDLNKINNNIDNLEWVTTQENVTHAIESGAWENIIKIDKNQLYDLYINQKKGLKEISDILNISEQVIYRNMKKYDIKTRTTGEARKIKYSIEPKTLKMKMKTKTQGQIAKEIGCVQSTISHAIERFKREGRWEQ